MAYTATLKKLAENLKATYENTIFQHSGNVGDSREKVLIEYLRQVMAHKYGFHSGEVFDENDTNSGQVDVIIYDNLFSTVFTDGSEKIVAPVESTFGIISVKSKMGTRELENAIDGLKTYNSLVRPSSSKSTIQIMPDFSIGLGSGLNINKSTTQQNINCIFAFDTTVAVETLMKKVQESNCVDLLVVPNKVCVIGKSRTEFGLTEASGSKLEFAAIHSEDSISLFILFLQIYLSKNHLIARSTEGLLLDIIKNSNYQKLAPVGD